MRIKLVFLLLAISFFPSGFVSTVFGNGASFQGLGDLPGGEYKSYAYGVSGDGSVVAGYSVSASGREVFRWTAEGGMVSLGNAYTAYGVSSNGSVIVGDSYFGTSSRQAFRWTTDGGIVGLGYLTGASKSGAFGVSDDGSVVVGVSSVSSTVYEAFRWTSDGGMIGLGDLAGGEFKSTAFDISADGSVVVGCGTSSSGHEAFRWTADGGMIGLGYLAGGQFMSHAKAVSGDGSVVVGYGYSPLGQEAFRWTSEGGMVGLGDLAGGPFESSALAVSADGSIVVGMGETTSNVHDYARYGEAFYWTESGGMQNLKDMLINLGADLTAWDSTTWTLTAATGISADGKTIVGYGFNGASPEAWIATIPPPTIKVSVDIKPQSCPNPLNVKSKGVLPVAILGTEDVNVIDIVIASIRLADPNVAPIRNSYEDVATPVFDANDCNCTTDGPDGFLDLTLKFETQRIVEAIGEVNHGDILTLMLTGVLLDETPIEGADCILIRGRHKPFNKADINKDGVVDMVDFNIFAKNWLQSSIVED